MRIDRGVVVALSVFLSFAIAEGCGGDDTTGATSNDGGGATDGTTSDAAKNDAAATDSGSDTGAPEDTGLRLFFNSGAQCALNAGSVGTFECWGTNNLGALGTGDCVTPGGLKPSALGFTPKYVSMGSYSFGCASDGVHTSCWGWNGEGELALDPATTFDGGAGCTDKQSGVPVPLAGLGTVTGIAAGYYTACAISDGHAVCWGWNDSAGAGPNDGGQVNAPTIVPNTDGAVEIEIGTAYGCVRKGDGSVWCWGSNLAGQLGQTPDNLAHPSAVQVTLGQQATQIASAKGGFTMCAVLADKTVSCWGFNGGIGGGPGGELGHDPLTDPQMCAGPDTPCDFTPTVVAGLSDVKEVTLGYKVTCALTNGGDVYCFGPDRYETLGHDPATDLDGGMWPYSFTPTKVAGLTNVAHIAMSAGMSCAIATDRHAMCWGQTEFFLQDAGVSATFTPMPLGL